MTKLNGDTATRKRILCLYLNIATKFENCSFFKENIITQISKSFDSKKKHFLCKSKRDIAKSFLITALCNSCDVQK